MFVTVRSAKLTTVESAHKIKIKFFLLTKVKLVNKHKLLTSQMWHFTDKKSKSYSVSVVRAAIRFLRTLEVAALSIVAVVAPFAPFASGTVEAMLMIVLHVVL
jgi:hypothetical protein